MRQSNVKGRLNRGINAATSLILMCTFSWNVLATNTATSNANVIEQPAKTTRIVSAGGTITEIIFALEGEVQLVGVDQSSLYPVQAQTMPIIGYYRDLAAEGVLSLQPTHLLTIEGAGREEALNLIKAAGVVVKKYKKPESIEGLLYLISQLGKDLDRKQQAASLIQQIKKQTHTVLSSFDQSSSGFSSREAAPMSAAALLSVSDRGVVVAGHDTMANFLFTSIGIKNVGEHHKGFKPMNIESLAVAQPTFLLVPKHVANAMGGIKAVCREPSLKLIKAAQKCRVLVMDSLLALSFTPRVAEGLQRLNTYKVSLND